MSLFAELRRRNVLKVALLYAVASLLILWAVDLAVEGEIAPLWSKEFVLLLLAIGLPVALIFAWVYEITPQGVKKGLEHDQTQSIVYKAGHKLNAAVAVLGVLGVAALIGERLLPEFEFVRPEPVEEVPLRPVYDSPLAAGVPKEITSYTLANGLRIIVWPDHDIPNVAMYNFVRAGGRNEYPGISGLSHFFEHMMFNGTDKLEPGEFDRIMEAAGGSNNARTSNDLTVYQDWFPRSALKTIFEIEAQRLEYLEFDDDMIDSERNVVYSERRSTIDNDNFGRLYEQMRAAAFVAHPYRLPVIGWASDVERWTKDDLRSYFKTYYAPNNCTMVFSGAVSPAEIFLLAEQYFSPIARQKPPPPVRTVEPEQQGERRIVIEAEAQTPLLHLAFHTGAAADPQTRHMSLLLQVLVGDSSSRLHRLLVEEEQVALSVGGWQDEGFDPGLVYLYLTLPPGSDVAAVEARVLDELARAATEGVTSAELSKAQNILLANYWRQLATIDGKASALGNYEVFTGSFENLFSEPDEISAVTREQLQAVAAKVFRRSNMTLGILRSPSDAPGDSS
ncbi:MAG: insulinase family protein [Gammaproteobacteria bacterium]|nr:insulinase family protein [Gammaproteobacteria bacterium]